jgi:multiple sugar transport system permease protein
VRAAAGQRATARRHERAGLAFTAPFMALFLAVFIAPMAYALYLSLFRDRLVGGTTFVGLGNYLEGLGDAAFTDGVGRVVALTAVQVPVMLVLATVLALVLDSGTVRLARLHRAVIFLPYAVPTVVGALMWGFLYGRDFGPIADVAGALGLGAPRFLGRGTMLWSLGNVVTWTFTGVNVIILHAALRAVPPEIYEAAALDGAGALRTALHIKLPLLRPALLLCTVFSVIGSLQLFVEPRVFQDIAPQVIGRSYTPNLYVYNVAFSDQRLGYAAALSFLLGIVVFAISCLVIRTTQPWETQG